MPEVNVEGLRDLVKELRKVDTELPKEIRQANLSVADLVADRTRSSFAGRSGVAPKVAGSVKTGATQRGAWIRIGGNAYPYALGSEFGSIAFKQFPAWRGSGDGSGYSLWPSIRASREEIEQSYLAAIDAVTKKAFPD